MQCMPEFLSALNDPYTVYYNEEETKEIKESTSGEYSGIGAAMMQNVQTGEITITTVYEDSPAEKAGRFRRRYPVSGR